MGLVIHLTVSILRLDIYKQKKGTILVILIVTVTLSWFFRYKPMSYGYLLDRWTNTTVHVEDLEKEQSFLSELIDEWSSSRKHSVEVITLKNELKQCNTELKRASNPFVQLYESGVMEQSIRAKKLDNNPTQ